MTTPMRQLEMFARGELAEVATSSRWCQRWLPDQRMAWQLADPGERFDARRYEVRRIDRATAKGFIVPRHYSGSHVACRQSFGLYRADMLVGVASYCVTTEQALKLVYPELAPGDESLELGRVVVADPEPGNTETWFQARCEEVLLASGVVGLVSFADPVPRVDAFGNVTFHGHCGFMYMGGNMFIAGRSTARTAWRLPDGTTLNGITMQKIRKQRRGHEAAERKLIEFGAKPMRAGQKPADWLREVRNDPGVRIALVGHPGCHRYIKPLGRNQRQRNQVYISDRIRELMSRQYPKQPDRLTLAA